MIKIDVQNLNVHFDKNHALKDVNIKISDNEITAIIGPSGCGKSTFIRCINRMNDLDPKRKGHRGDLGGWRGHLWKGC